MVITATATTTAPATVAVAERPVPTPKHRPWWWLFSLVGVVLIGLVHLPFPFQGDHAFFATVASALQGGARLYVDLWDINQPGIFLFYLAAGTMFGFTEWGIHLFELLYWLGFSIVLLTTVGRRMANPVIASLLPIFTVGAYYMSSDRGRLMKLEALTVFPIFVAVWLAYRFTTNPNKWLLFGSGVAGGITVSFKLALAVVLIPIWLLTLFYIVRTRNRPWWRTFAQVFPPVFLGSLIPIGLLVVQLIRWDALKIAFDTAFLYPFRYLSDVPRAPLERLLEGFMWLMRDYGPTLLVGAIGLWFGWRVIRDRLVVYLTTWIVFGLILHLLQNKTWWAYHLHMITFAVGILAVMGIDRLWKWGSSRTASRKRLAVGFAIGVMVMLLPVATALTARLTSLTRNGFAIEAGPRLAFQDRFSGDLYGHITEEVAFLKTTDSRPGPIFVAGDPLYYWLSGRKQAVVLNGWALEFYFPEQWTDLADQVDSVLPVYVFVEHNYEHLVPVKGSDLVAVLDQKYQVIRVSEHGTWHELIAP